jgi:hypothetical protein
MMPLLMKESLGTYFFLYDFFHRQRVLVKSGGCRKIRPPPIYLYIYPNLYNSLSQPFAIYKGGLVITIFPSKLTQAGKV